MAQKKTKVRYVDINVNKDNFVSRLIGTKKQEDFSDVKFLRNILTKEKARIIYTLKNSKPSSIYNLAKMLQRDLKAVRNDVKILERMGIVEFILEKKGKRESLKPILAIERLEIIIDI